MTLHQFEMQIVHAVRQVTGNQKIGLKHLMEWSTGKVEAKDGEVEFRIGSLGVNALFLLPVGGTIKASMPVNQKSNVVMIKGEKQK